jgi:hypothetical protein
LEKDLEHLERKANARTKKIKIINSPQTHKKMLDAGELLNIFDFNLEAI